ncbi:hypothetical protein J7E70_27620 [Variovorax paradoxus]|nr:hypothetical protein [Variovorax paradoxus]MBT2304208.1 hypothetical protein [Variovorax paradoxus]
MTFAQRFIGAETLPSRMSELDVQHRVRIGLDDDINRPTTLLSLAGETQERMRREHAEAMAGRDQDLRQAEERQAEAGLREQLAAQGIDLAQARSQTEAEALAANVKTLEGRIDDEKAAHEKTRRMLAEALVSKSAAKSDASARRRRKLLARVRRHHRQRPGDGGPAQNAKAISRAGPGTGRPCTC